jgi:hypothetical protein
MEALKEIEFTVTQTVSTEMVKNILIGAFEGGSNYWYCGLEVDHWPDGMSPSDFKYWHAEVPLHKGGVLRFRDQDDPYGDGADEEGYYHLSIDNITSGMAAMKAKYPRHWTDFITEGDDAITADVFLQCCIFGDIIYG